MDILWVRKPKCQDGDLPGFRSSDADSKTRILDLMEFNQKRNKWKCRLPGGKECWVPKQELLFRNKPKTSVESQFAVCPEDFIDAECGIPAKLKGSVSLNDFGETFEQVIGTGMFADKEFDKGDIIFIETPVMELNTSELLEQKTIREQWSRLTDELQQLVLTLYHKDSFTFHTEPRSFESVQDFGDPRTRIYRKDINTQDPIEKAFAIFRANSFSTEKIGKPDLSSLFLLLSRINHSCNPNAKRLCIDVSPENGTTTSSLIAVRKIPKGSEITISYLSDFKLLQPYHSRKKFLATWDFICICDRCSPELASNLCVDNTRVFKCQTCSDGKRAGLTTKGLFSPCSNPSCNKAVKIKNLVKRGSLNGKVGALSKKHIQKTGDKKKNSKKGYIYDITIKAEERPSDLNPKDTKSNRTNKKFTSIQLHENSFEFVDHINIPGDINDKSSYPEGFTLDEESLVIKDEYLYEVEKKIVFEYFELERTPALILINGPSSIEVVLESALQTLSEEHWVIERLRDMLFDIHDQMRNYQSAIKQGEKCVEFWNDHIKRLSQSRAWKLEKMGDLSKQAKDFHKAYMHYQLAIDELSSIFPMGSHYVTTAENKMKETIEGNSESEQCPVQ